MFTFFKKYRGNRGNTLTFQQSFELDWNATSHIGVGTLHNAKQFFKRHHLLWFRSSNPKNVFKICPFKFAFLPVPQFPPRFYPPITYLATAKRALHQNKKNIFLNKKHKGGVIIAFAKSQQQQQQQQQPVSRLRRCYMILHMIAYLKYRFRFL